MKRKLNKKKVVLLFLLILLFTGGLYISIKKMEQSKNSNISGNYKNYIAIIAKSKDSNFWHMVFSGANAASTEYNVRITTDGPANEEDYQAQNKMIEKAVRAGADAIIFSAVDYQANSLAINAAMEQGVKVVVIDSDVNSDGVGGYISTDNLQAGYTAGLAALKSDEAIINIGIVNFDKSSANGQQREQGFLEAVNKDSRVNKIEKINVKSTIEDALEGTKEMIQKNPDINVIVTFNEWTSLGVGYAVQELDIADTTNVVAFDNNEISVGMLENGEVDALIVQNPYAMGYLGVEYAYNLINGISISEKNIETNTMLVTRENMFDEECQKLLFSFGEEE